MDTDKFESVVLALAGAAAGGLAAAMLSRRVPSLRGQTVLITGGSRGLGVALAREFGAEGCRLAICARDGAALETARLDLERRGAEVLAVECDVGDEAQVARMVERVLAHYGTIDVLVNNAGTIEVGPVETMALEDFDRAMRVMFWGVVYPTMAVLPHMLERGTGRIVNITSIGGKIAVPHLLPYTCAKFAAVGFSEGLHAELKGRGVKVITIAPGLMRTGSHLNAFFRGDTDREALWFSMGATMPGVSMSASRAARQIVAAARSGRAEKILSVPANLLARFHGLFPGATADMLGLVDRLVLPSGLGRERKRGRDTRALQSRWMAGVTLLGQMAATRFLQESGRRPEPAVH